MKKVVIYKGKCIADHIMLRNAIVAIAIFILNKISMLEPKMANRVSTAFYVYFYASLQS